MYKKAAPKKEPPFLFSPRAKSLEEKNIEQDEWQGDANQKHKKHAHESSPVEIADAVTQANAQFWG